MNGHPVLWTSPTPLWGRFGTTIDGASFRAADQTRPAILRFTSDEFMEQLLAMLTADPRQLGTILARPETWRTPATDEAPDLVERIPMAPLARSLKRLRAGRAVRTGLAPTAHQDTVRENSIVRTLTLKLYHPAAQRHYVVAANLVCALTGFPDRALATGGSDRVGFVVRRLLPPKNATTSSPLDEFAFVKDAAGARWQRIAPDARAADATARLVDGEELLPLFPLNFRDDTDHPRRLLAGVVPVGRREEYMSTRAQHEAPGAGAAGVAATPSPVAARKEQLKLDVVEPWKNLVRTAHAAVKRILDVSGGTVTDLATKQTADAARTNEQLQGQSWLLLLDFADYLALHLPEVWACVVDPAGRDTLSTAARRLFDWLDGPATAPGSDWPMNGGNRPFATSLRDALKRIRASDQVRAGLEGAVRPFPADPGSGLQWPDFLYLLAGVRESGGTFAAAGVHESLSPFSSLPTDPDDVDAPAQAPLDAAESKATLLDSLVQLVVTAFDPMAPPTPAPPVPFAVRLRDALATTEGDPGWFVLRCAYVRGDCGPLHPAVVSAQSQRFQLASFFDPDAPARPIRIALPIDTTPAGMRKFNKNTAFVISDVLCGQIQRAKGLGFVDLVRSVLPWPLHKDLDVAGMGPCERSPGLSLGMICSLSIPIITICALILLIIIVTLLDLIFRWLPWFILCFPVPRLKAKS